MKKIFIALSTLAILRFNSVVTTDDAFRLNDDISQHPVTVEFVSPLNGDEILYTPYRVEVKVIGNFQVPADGELQIAMTYEGRGTQVRVLQGLYFMCWNVGDSELEIRAQLVSTRDVPVGSPASIRVRQRPGPHFVLWSPADRQIFVAQRS